MIIIIRVIFVITIIRGINCSNLFFQLKSKALKVLKNVDPMFYIRITTLLSNGAFDAIAPYHETLNTGIYSNIAKRPKSEWTEENKNIAIAYACFRILNYTLPSNGQKWEKELKKAGLDPKDVSLDITTPQGIGNYVAESILSFRLNDGMNQEGNENGRVYTRQLYEDTLDYKPKNNEFDIEYPNYWQPDIIKTSYGQYSAQMHVYPQLAVVRPYSLTDLSRYEALPPEKSFISNIDGYVEQVQEVLRESYTLDDMKKMAAEYFNDKVLSLEGSLEAIIQKYGLNLNEYIFLQFAVKVALFDSSIVMWREKLRYDAVRPFTAIRYLYGNTTVKSWAGSAAVDDLNGTDWKSYLQTPAHSEYPSASSCFCAAQAQVLRRFFKSNIINQSVKYAKGTSKIEGCRTPSEELKLEFGTYDEFVHVCGLSRLYAGVHFMAAINEGKRVCQMIGDTAYDYVNSHFIGFS